MFNLKEEPYDMYINMLFIDLSNVSKNVFRAIRGGIGNLTYEISISHKKGTETLQFYQAHQNGVAVELPTFYVKKHTNEQGNDLYSGGYKVNKSGKSIERTFPMSYAEDLYKGCKRMIEYKEIRSSRIVSK